MNCTSKSSTLDILLVNDESANGQRLINHLSGQDYAITQANTCEEALTVIKKGFKPDLILLNITMSAITDFHLTRQVREICQADELPLILLGNPNQINDLMAGLEAGANDYLIQPIIKQELIAKINIHVKICRLKVENIRLQREREELKHENIDLRILLETSTEHGDTVVEQLHDQAEEVAQESEHRLVQFLEAVPVGVVVLDKRGKLYFMNKKAKDIFGKGIDTKTPIEELSAVYRIYSALTQELYPPETLPIVRALQGESGAADDLEVHRENKIVPIEIWTTPIYDAEGNIAYSINALQDITERKRTEKLLTQYNTTLEQDVADRTRELSQTLDCLKATQNQLVESEKMAALGNLVAGVAHEINTPLGTAIMTASFLENATQRFARACEQGRLKRSVLQEYLDQAIESSQLVLRNVQRAGKLVQSFKQVAVDQVSLEQRSFALKTYIEETLRNLDPHLKQTQHTLTVEGDETIMINNYPGALAQVVTNLVMNSITHAYQPNEGGQLRFKVMQAKTRAIIHYTDDGCGIPTQNIGKIFEPFFTTARNKGGTGLGLHIVYNLVTQKMQGTIRCESEVGAGTTFLIDLPLVVRDGS
ncbi:MULTISPECIES: ATP-binding protein [unclassified Coleofasciculus]|uniref:ATP-binding protein n=1 Tax=unclassified Coleofasciculus TaxID=2692782 RepID=UPI001882A0D1|nr:MULTISPECIES: ATP-binding protein [unclassified Coleofasciculus]MBE9129679.1 response regulator [Coleofasciculus sp. LEGE 07081]MBE9152192.1 response regulator [Coleofasciculus sp. LEGE 07092]